MIAGRRISAVVARALPAVARPVVASVATRGVPAVARPVTAIAARAFGCHGYTEQQGIIYPAPSAKVGSPAPAWKGSAVVDGNEISQISSTDYNGKWTALLFYPKDFTFVCPTELIAFSDRAGEFEAINTQVVGVSIDTPEVHLAWCRTPRKQGGLGRMRIPLLADVTKEISARYGVLVPEAGIALRGLFLIDPQGTLQHATINNFPVGRNVDEALRLINAFQYVAKHGEVCPAGWKPGDKTMRADPVKSLEYFETTDEVSSKVRAVSSMDEYNNAIKKGKVVVKFYATWCNKCTMLAPTLDSLAEELEGVSFIAVDMGAKEFHSLAQSVPSLPTVRLYRDGKQVGEDIIGYKKKAVISAVESL